MRVVVVGAGLSGLAAAWTLSRAGHEVELLERRERVGGRFGGRFEEGFALDACPPVVAMEDRQILAWIGAIDSLDGLLPPRPLQQLQLSGAGVESIDARSLRSIARIRGVDWRSAARLMRLPRLMRRYAAKLDPRHPELAADLDWRSAADFGRLYFGPRVFQHWMAPSLLAHYGGDEEELSRVAFLLQWVAERQGEGRPGILRRGLQDLAGAAAEALDVRCAVEVSRVVTPARGGVTVECRSERGEQVLDADAVVLAVNAQEALRIADASATAAERDILSAVKYADRTALVLGLERPLAPVPLQLRAPVDASSPLESAILEPGASEGRAPLGCGLATLIVRESFLRAHSGLAADVLQKSLLASLAPAYPQLAGLVRHASFVRRQHCIPRFEVGAYNALARFQRVQRDRRAQGRRLYFAGDHLVGPSAENAVVSGQNAAAAVLAD